MGKVATIFKVYAEDNVDAQSLSRDMATAFKPTSMQMEEIGFGIKVIKIMFVHDDSEGSTEYEKKLKEFPGVKEVEVEEESLL